MTARNVVTRAGRYDVSGTGYKPEGQITRAQRRLRLSNTPTCMTSSR
jgi:hypothetical protein